MNLPLAPGPNQWKIQLDFLVFQARSKLRHHSAAVQVPIGLEEEFHGLVDLVKMKAYYFQGSNGYVFLVLHEKVNFKIFTLVHCLLMQGKGCLRRNTCEYGGLGY